MLRNTDNNNNNNNNNNINNNGKYNAVTGRGGP
jgi:hypothetical protein